MENARVNSPGILFSTHNSYATKFGHLSNPVSSRASAGVPPVISSERSESRDLSLSLVISSVDNFRFCQSSADRQEDVRFYRADVQRPFTQGCPCDPLNFHYQVGKLDGSFPVGNENNCFF